MNIFQLSKDDIEYSSTLEESDIGKWCFLIQGCYHGFCDNREDVEKMYKAVFKRRNNEKRKMF